MSKPAKVILSVIVLAIALSAAGGLFYLFGRVTPAEVALVTPSPAATGTASQPPATATQSTAPTGVDGLSGSWTVDPSVGSFADFSGSFVGYRVQEELVGIGAATAVGRTPDVTGSFTLHGATITAASLEANLTTLRSDSDVRDGQLRNQGIEWGRFPSATFVLTAPIELGEIPAEGLTISATAVGDFTLHGVTRSIELPLQALLSGGVITVVGSIDIAFADYDIERPQSMRVLSVADHGLMELQLRFKQG